MLDLPILDHEIFKYFLTILMGGSQFLNRFRHALLQSLIASVAEEEGQLYNQVHTLIESDLDCLWRLCEEMTYYLCVGFVVVYFI